MQYVPAILNILIMITGLLLIGVVLLQRGKGGGLAGAFGGIGGSSAFGSRAGDLFTRITIIAAAVWILLIMLTVKIVQPPVQTKKAPAPATSTDESRLVHPQERSATDIG